MNTQSIGFDLLFQKQNANMKIVNPETTSESLSESNSNYGADSHNRSRDLNISKD